MIIITLLFYPLCVASSVCLRPIIVIMYIIARMADQTVLLLVLVHLFRLHTKQERISHHANMEKNKGYKKPRN